MTDPYLPALPQAFASLHFTRAKTGAIVKVRIITPAAVYFRTYPVPAVTDEVIRAALRSVQISSAWVQGVLG